MWPGRKHSFMKRFAELQPQEAKHLSQWEVGEVAMRKDFYFSAWEKQSDVTGGSEMGRYDTPPTPTFDPVNLLCVFLFRVFVPISSW